MTKSDAMASIELLSDEKVADSIETVGYKAEKSNSDSEKAELILGKNGFKYYVPDDSSSTIADSGESSNSSSGNIGTAEDNSETILTSWEDADNYLEEDTLKYLKNDFLISQMKNISISIMSGTITATYSADEFRVKITEYLVKRPGDKHFEFGCEYPSELYNIHSITVNDTCEWQAFSYKGYDKLEYVSAVRAKEDKVYEVNFYGCKEDFILNVLKDVKGK
jgi:hypothetical protein